MPAVGDIYAITVTCFQSDISQASENVLHYQVSAVAGAGLTDQVLANDFFNHVATPYLDWMPAGASLVSVKAQKIHPLPRLVAAYSTLAAQDGLAAHELLPPQATGLIHYSDGTANRKAVARSYVGFPARDWLDTVIGDGTVNAAGVTALQAIASILQTGMTLGAGGNTVSLTFGTYNKAAGAFLPLTLATVPKGFATQKRRSFFGPKNVL